MNQNKVKWMETENWKIDTSTFEYNHDLNIYFIPKLSRYYFENIKHVENNYKDISEFLLNKVDESMLTENPSKALHLIALKIPNFQVRIEHLKGIWQQVNYLVLNIHIVQ